MNSAKLVLFTAVVLAIVSSPVAAGDELARRAVAILRDRCISCHDESKSESGLRLDSRDHLQAGGDREGSLLSLESDNELIRRISSRDSDEWMPSEGERLSDLQIATLQAWIAGGAAWPTVNQSETDWPDDRELHWAWQPIGASEVPSWKDNGWAKNEIDGFVLKGLRAAGLKPSPQASPAVLIRRLYFDLIGLPPSPEEVAAFVEDSDLTSYEKLVDRLLASPRLGERWARHWLDVAHYADTHGYDKDQPRPHAWPYRDYVIRAFNEDKPYDQFVREQIAGDALFPGTRDGIEAMGFVAAGPWDLIGHAEVPESKIDGKIARHLDRDDMLSTVIGTFCSVTIHCAQCHDHKFDPFSQADYFALQSVFAAVDRADRSFFLDPHIAQQHRDLSGRKQLAEQEIADLVAEWALPRSDADVDGLDDGLSSRLDRAIGWLNEVELAIKSLPPPEIVYCATVHTGGGNFVGTGATGGTPRPIHVLARGNVQQPGIVAEIGSLSVLKGLPGRFVLPENHREQDRRVALANWVSSEANPLTWRSIVNRIWQYHLGRGIVDTANDFGRMSSMPTHPELLDWLAADFRDHGGSLKRLHKQIVMSATYRQSSSADTDHSQDDRLYSSQDRRKLDAEAIRDAVLSVSGKLNLQMGGPGFQDFVVLHPEHSPHYRYDLADANNPATFRRSIYRFIVRSQTQPFLTSLDCADPSIRVAKRNESVSPLQALSLLNNGFMIAQSEHFASRLRTEFPVAVDRQVRRAVQLAFAREPSNDEVSLLTKFVESNSLESLCRTLLNSNEFAFVD